MSVLETELFTRQSQIHLQRVRSAGLDIINHLMCLAMDFYKAKLFST